MHSRPNKYRLWTGVVRSSELLSLLLLPLLLLVLLCSKCTAVHYLLLLLLRDAWVHYLLFSAMKECEALKSLEEILSLDVVDNQFVWSSPIVAANTSLPAQAAATAPTTTFIGHGFCEISGSPDRWALSYRFFYSILRHPFLMKANLCMKLLWNWFLIPERQINLLLADSIWRIREKELK